MDSPNETLVFEESPPAHRINTAQNTGLWIAAGLLGLMDVVLLIMLLARG